jgi:hypothetical protein
LKFWKFYPQQIQAVLDKLGQYAATNPSIFLDFSNYIHKNIKDNPLRKYLREADNVDDAIESWRFSRTNSGRHLRLGHLKFINYIKRFNNNATNPTGRTKVYRVMRSDQPSNMPIRSKNPRGLNTSNGHWTINAHVNNGSSGDTPYISSFADRDKALAQALKDGNKMVVEIDLTKFQSVQIDLSLQSMRDQLLNGPRPKNYAKKSTDFLIITDEIPTSAIRRIN